MFDLVVSVYNKKCELFLDNIFEEDIESVFYIRENDVFFMNLFYGWGISKFILCVIYLVDKCDVILVMLLFVRIDMCWFNFIWDCYNNKFNIGFEMF